jgi:acyl-CoA reductase-like NAD-dependent aldehyde dehydrogenase
VPAPQRGEILRQMGEALREKKTLLGKLVSMEELISKHDRHNMFS